MYYVLGVNQFDRGFAHCEYDDDSIFDEALVEKCPLCGSNVSAIPIVKPYHIKLNNKKIGDFVFGIFEYFLVSQRFKDLYENSSLTGIELFEKIDRIRCRKEVLDVALYKIEPKRIGITLGYQDSKSKSNGRAICELCNPYGEIVYGGMGLEITSKSHLDIPDIFTTYMTGMAVYCSQKFVDFCLAHTVLNFKNHYESFADYSSGSWRGGRKERN